MDENDRGPRDDAVYVAYGPPNATALTVTSFEPPERTTYFCLYYYDAIDLACIYN